MNQSGSASPHEEQEVEPRKKKFNLKKQLSRVDIKLKFHPRNNKRSNSVFYPDNMIPDESPTSLSPEEETVPVIKEPETEDKPERPSELPLFEERPTPPPRSRDKRDKEQPKRDTRLLSVPNIKYHQKPNQSMSSVVRKMSKSHPIPRYQRISSNPPANFETVNFLALLYTFKKSFFVLFCVKDVHQGAFELMT